ncbi:DUF2929 family protein [Aciduricibacillus chroicocephali]|uniref:DUF2929 family protein n=1 Tax=Aciduricibacillus chroicocephali TaxID=3054939 RepID=A0ABY9KXN7_9BACI|nr:DUF2929 family protein [Bacillaceae bacterium 44XB]
MRYIMTLIWGIAIGSAISYMLTAMGGQEFSFVLMFAMVAVISLTVFIVGEGILGDSSKSETL